MEYFKSGLKSVLGTQQPITQPTGAETVEKLVERVNYSTLLEDRRDACRALKSLSKKYRIEVGTQGMDSLIQILGIDRADSEIVGYALETLCNITSPSQSEEESELIQIDINVGEQFTEIFIKSPENINLVLNFLEEFDFRVRWPAVKLLTALLKNKPKDIQDIVLVSPMAVSKLMDLLADTREVIRNDALLLLTQLTKSNANIQKIVAFENAFDRLFDVLKEEGFLEGGIVVEDCLLLMLNLLKNNTSNINFFKEGSYIQRLQPMFKLPDDLPDIGWSPQKASNFHCVLQLVRTIVSPNNPLQIISVCQKNLRNALLLEDLCNILMANGVPADILTETINAVAEVIRGNLNNQDYLSTVLTPSNPPRSAIVVLLMSMINEKQPFGLRCAVLYCFECFLFKNEIAQQQVVQTLLPSTANASTQTTGQLLCTGLFNTDPLSNWFSATALFHTLIENPAQKEQLLRVLLTANVGSLPVSLLHQCATFLQHTNKLQSKLGILMLLSTWMSHCPPAVTVFLNVPGAMAFLIAQTSATEYDNNEDLVQGLCAFLMGICVLFNDNTVSNYNKDNLSQLIEKRVGLEVYASKLGDISRHEVYAQAAKQPQLKVKYTAELLLEYEFCKLFKALEGVIIKALGVQKQLANGMTELSLSEQENSLLLQYKNLIRDQDRRLHDLNSELSKTRQQSDALQVHLSEVQHSHSLLEDQNIVLKAQLSTGTAHTSSGLPPTQSQYNEDTTVYLQHQIMQLQALNQQQDEELARLRKDQEHFLQLLSDQEILKAHPITPTNDLPLIQPQYNEDTTSHLQHQIKQLQALNQEREEQLERLQKDQEDFLELLSDQELKLKAFKNRLRELGENIEDDESDDNISDADEDVK